jgi:glucose-1-phosphate cytidylyltransferase
MKTVILAGGFGTRIAEYSGIIPKPMVEIGEHPIIWHIMNWYASFGYNDFVIALGYKASIIKEYFLNYYSVNCDFEVDLANGEIKFINKSKKNWKITLVDTGYNTMTGGRVKRLQNVIGNNTFMMTYGDGLSNVNINELVKFHKEKNKIATLTCVHPTARYGELNIDSNGSVNSFKEKPQLDQGRINGGFFVLEPAIFKYLVDDNTVFEREPMEGLVRDNQLNAFIHNGFWQPMDTLREKQILDELWKKGNAPWKTEN